MPGREGGRAFWTDTIPSSGSVAAAAPRGLRISICAHYLHRLTNASWLVLRQPLSIRRCCACSSKAGKQALGDELAGKGEIREAGRTVSSCVWSLSPREHLLYILSPPHREGANLTLFICPHTHPFLAQSPHPHLIPQFNSVHLRGPTCAKLGIRRPIQA